MTIPSTIVSLVVAVTMTLCISNLASAAEKAIPMDVYNLGHAEEVDQLHRDIVRAARTVCSAKKPTWFFANSNPFAANASGPVV